MGGASGFRAVFVFGAEKRKGFNTEGTEWRAEVAEKSANMSAQCENRVDFDVEVLRASSSDALRMTSFLVWVATEG